MILKVISVTIIGNERLFKKSIVCAVGSSVGVVGRGWMAGLA